jgi:succinate dehydrogenase / fumarate reductase cytochrome b subunit
MKKTRPLSPHLTIYRPQISSLLSISHRISGILLFIGALFICWFVTAAVFCPDFAQCSYIDSMIVKFAMLAWTMMLFFHLLNGIRHLFWDMGHGFEIKTMNRSGILVVLTTLLLTLVVYFIKGQL